MKRILALLLAIVICISLSSCALVSKSANTISYNDDASEVYYNGRTYIDYNNTNGKYRLDLENSADNQVELATVPYGIFYIFGAVTVFYGNNAENPDYITNSRTIDLYVREDVLIDNSLTLSVCDTADPFHFRLSDVTTGQTVAYDIEKESEFKHICNFFAEYIDYPGLGLWIAVYEQDGIFYLQDAWNSDYCQITDAFKDDIWQFGVNSFDYH